MISSKNGFIPENVISFADSGRQIVISGYAMDGYLDDMRPRAAIFVGGKPFRAIKCKLRTEKLPPIEVIRRDGNMMSYMAYFCIDLSDVSKKLASGKNAKLVVIGEREDRSRVMIYKMSLDKAYSIMMNVNLDVVESSFSDGKTIIKGRVDADPSLLTLKIHSLKQDDNSGKGKKTGAGVDGNERVGNSEVTEITEYTPEFSEDGNFVITVSGEYKKIRLTASLEDKTSTQDISIGRSHKGPALSGDVARYYEKVSRNLKDYGFRETVNKIKTAVTVRGIALNKRYGRWINQVTPDAQELKVQSERQKDFFNRPLLSILVPLYETEERYLKELIDSVKAQTYPNWELCFSDGSRDSTRLKALVEKLSEKDERIKFIARKQGPLKISENTNQAYTLARGDYLVLGDHDDLFAPDALYQVVKVLNEGENVDVVYTDEDKTNDIADKRFDPNMKPEFNLELMESCNYITHMFVLKRTLIRDIGLFDERFNGAQDYDFILRCIEKAENVKHINRILYSWRINDTSTAGNPAAKMYAYDAGALALQEHYDRVGIKAKAEIGDHLGYYHTKYELKGNEQLYIVVINADDDEAYEKTVQSIKSKSVFRDIEYIRIKNEDNPILSRQLNSGIDEVEVLVNADDSIDDENVYVMFIEAGVTMMGEDGVYELLSYISNRENVGAIGGKIYCANETISHSGVILGVEHHPGYQFINYGQYTDQYFNSAAYSSLRRGVFMMKLNVIRKYGEFSGRYSGEYSVIEYTYKMTKDGLKSIYNANANFRLGDSKGKDADEVFESADKTLADKKLFDERYNIKKIWDLYYPR